ncbi:unnamed protein product [Arctogadus glacialis]
MSHPLSRGQGRGPLIMASDVITCFTRTAKVELLVQSLSVVEKVEKGKPAGDGFPFSTFTCCHPTNTDNRGCQPSASGLGYGPSHIALVML